MPAERPLALLPTEPPAGAPREAGAPRGDRAGDLLLTAALLVVSLLPLLCDRLEVGQWGAGTLGLGTAGAVLAARALWDVLRERGGAGDGTRAAIRALPRA